MKNVWKLLIALALVLCMTTALVACAGDGEDPVTDPGTTDGGTPDGGTPDGGNPEDPGNDTTGVDGTLTQKGSNTEGDYGTPN